MNKNKLLARQHGAKEVCFADLPRSHQLAIIHYMADEDLKTNPNAPIIHACDDEDLIE